MTGLTGLLSGLTGLATVFSQVIAAVLGFVGVFASTTLPALVALFFSTLGPFAGT